ncbi:Cryptic asc operon repressor [Cedecea neteri]|uniref:Cryptic asc operon repressor n=1 Tax=Cedecea neteri TaxID=158822 RepID=A0A2X3J8B0_9ENTR|nr:Cryptic asc operon repressor [Cedecea neteri]
MDALIEQHKQPIMVMNRKLRKHQSHCICCDHKGSSFNATRYVIEQGHRDIAFITGVLDSPTARRASCWLPGGDGAGEFARAGRANRHRKMDARQRFCRG